jgi:hypothetical protein
MLIQADAPRFFVEIFRLIRRIVKSPWEDACVFKPKKLKFCGFGCEFGVIY